MSGEASIWSLIPGEAGYPSGLDDLDRGRRPRLRGVGDRDLVAGLDPEATATIVGSRNASAYGLRVAERLGRDLALAGITVVSGLARGIDAAAHNGALAGGGRTIAVVAGGPDIVYPARNARLYGQVLATGALVSEHPPGIAPRPGFFVERNRIMAALSAVSVIVEAALPSGSLITADNALALGRTVGAVPGQLGVRVAEGTNELIRDGAHLIRDARDVLDLLYGVGVQPPESDDPDRPVPPKRAPVPRAGPPLDHRLARVRELVAGGCASVDRVAIDGELDSREAAVALARLELLGYVVADALGGWSATALEAPE
jgi:DNA processing protein